MKNKLMAHLVAGFPNLETSLVVAKALIEGGATYLEVQFPFSDPSADGPAIQAACTEALSQGFKVAQGWELVDKLHAEYPQVPVFVMSYASIVVARGIEAFVADAKRHNVALIIPDLAPGADDGLFAEGQRQGVPIVPVIVPTVSPQRLEAILQLKPEWVYTAVRTGITGTHTTLTPELETFLARINSRAKVLAGFGIDSPSQVQALAGKVHAPVIGSAFVRKITSIWQTKDLSETEKLKELVFQLQELVKQLTVS
jgi:tryptophan synthase alpha chain